MSWTKVQAGHPMWPAKRVKALVFGQPILAALKGMALALSVAYIEGPLLIISAILASGVVLPYLFWASLSERSSFAAGSFALFQLAFIGAVVGDFVLVTLPLLSSTSSTVALYHVAIEVETMLWFAGNSLVSLVLLGIGAIVGKSMATASRGAANMRLDDGHPITRKISAGDFHLYKISIDEPGTGVTITVNRNKAGVLATSDFAIYVEPDSQDSGFSIPDAARSSVALLTSPTDSTAGFNTALSIGGGKGGSSTMRHRRRSSSGMIIPSSIESARPHQSSDGDTTDTTGSGVDSGANGHGATPRSGAVTTRPLTGAMNSSNQWSALQWTAENEKTLSFVAERRGQYSVTVAGLEGRLSYTVVMATGASSSSRISKPTIRWGAVQTTTIDKISQQQMSPKPQAVASPVRPATQGSREAALSPPMTPNAAAMSPDSPRSETDSLSSMSEAVMSESEVEIAPQPDEPAQQSVDVNMIAVDIPDPIAASAALAETEEEEIKIADQTVVSPTSVSRQVTVQADHPPPGPPKMASPTGSVANSVIVPLDDGEIPPPAPPPPVYSVEELKADASLPGVNLARIELHLTPEDFQATFNLDAAAWLALPKFVRQNRIKEAGFPLESAPSVGSSAKLRQESVTELPTAVAPPVASDLMSNFSIAQSVRTVATTGTTHQATASAAANRMAATDPAAAAINAAIVAGAETTSSWWGGTTEAESVLREFDALPAPPPPSDPHPEDVRAADLVSQASRANARAVPPSGPPPPAVARAAGKPDSRVSVNTLALGNNHDNPPLSPASLQYTASTRPNRGNESPRTVGNGDRWRGASASPRDRPGRQDADMISNGSRRSRTSVHSHASLASGASGAQRRTILAEMRRERREARQGGRDGGNERRDRDRDGRRDNRDARDYDDRHDRDERHYSGRTRSRERPSGGQEVVSPRSARSTRSTHSRSRSRGPVSPRRTAGGSHRRGRSVGSAGAVRDHGMVVAAPAWSNQYYGSQAAQAAQAAAQAQAQAQQLQAQAQALAQYAQAGGMGHDMRSAGSRKSSKSRVGSRHSSASRLRYR